ncbi:MAG TPA: hypothetical protein VF620_03910 [Allosphingosinicella sp.]|jgi:hypothetical protein
MNSDAINVDTQSVIANTADQPRRLGASAAWDVATGASELGGVEPACCMQADLGYAGELD